MLGSFFNSGGMLHIRARILAETAKSGVKTN